MNLRKLEGGGGWISPRMSIKPRTQSHAYERDGFVTLELEVSSSRSYIKREV